MRRRNGWVDGRTGAGIVAGGSAGWVGYYGLCTIDAG